MSNDTKPVEQQAFDPMGLSQYDNEIEEHAERSVQALADALSQEDEVEDEQGEAEQAEAPAEDNKQEDKPAAPEDESVEVLKEKLSRLEKQHKDSRDWYTDLNKKIKERTAVIGKAINKMQQEGRSAAEIAETFDLKPEDVDSIMSGDEYKLAAAADPFAFKVNQFNDKFKAAESLGLATKLLPKGEDRNAFFTDLGATMLSDPTLQKEFIESENELDFVFSEKVIEAVQTYRDAKSMGETPIKAVKTLKQQIAERDAKIAELEAKIAGGNNSDDELSTQPAKKPRPTLNSAAPVKKADDAEERSGWMGI